jgi:capsule polysaccharide export protein KpsE/RkpR
MSIKDTIATLQNDVRDNKDATASVQAALETYAKANGDLTQQLKDALDKADLDGADETALKQIAADLEANNSALHAAAPATAAAVVENTPAQV